MLTRRFPAVVFAGLVMAASASAGVNRWTTNGPWGGPVVCAARDPSSPNLLYAGTEKGLYLSRNGGASWSLATARGQYVFAIGISVQAPVSVYALVSPGTLLRSSDLGRTWHASTPFGQEGARSLAVDTLGVVYASSYLVGIWRSADGGDTWAKSNMGLGEPPPAVLDMAVVKQAGLVYAATSGGIFRSGDSGVNWSRVSELGVLDLDVDEEGVIYAAHIFSGILFSADGLTWSALEPGAPLSPRLVAAARDGDTVWASDGDRIIQWRDEMGWLELARPGMSREIRSLLGLSEGLVLVSSSSGLFRSRPDAGWDLLDEGLQGKLVHDLAFDDDPQLLYASGGFDVFRSAGVGQSWTSFRPPGVAPGECSAQIVGIETMRTPEGLALYAGTSGGGTRACFPTGGLWRSFDGGASWALAASFGLIRSLAVDPLERRHSYLSALSCVFMPPPTNCAFPSTYGSEDGGETWRTRSFQPINSPVIVLSVDPNDPRVVYGKFVDTLVRSGDSGATWSEEPGINRPSTVLVSTAHPSEVLAATFAGPLYRSFDRGVTWQRTALDPPAPILTLAEDPRDSDVLVAGTAGAGVLRSEDRGETWEPDNRGIENLFVYDLQFDPTGRILHAATDQGVFSRETRSPRLVAPR